MSKSQRPRTMSKSPRPAIISKKTVETAVKNNQFIRLGIKRGKLALSGAVRNWNTEEGKDIYYVPIPSDATGGVVGSYREVWDALLDLAYEKGLTTDDSVREYAQNLLNGAFTKSNYITNESSRFNSALDRIRHNKKTNLGKSAGKTKGKGKKKTRRSDKDKKKNRKPAKSMAEQDVGEPRKRGAKKLSMDKRIENARSKDMLVDVSRMDDDGKLITMIKPFPLNYRGNKYRAGDLPLVSHNRDTIIRALNGLDISQSERDKYLAAWDTKNSFVQGTIPVVEPIKRPSPPTEPKAKRTSPAKEKETKEKETKEKEPKEKAAPRPKSPGLIEKDLPAQKIEVVQPSFVEIIEPVEVTPLPALGRLPPLTRKVPLKK